jgi:hypothetical protein
MTYPKKLKQFQRTMNVLQNKGVETSDKEWGIYKVEQYNARSLTYAELTDNKREREHKEGQR